MKIAVSGRRSKYWLKQNPVETINYFNSVLFGELAGRILTEGKKKSQDINEAWGFGLKEIELISGMAEGIDLLWAQLGIVLGLKVYCYLPCIDQYTLMNDYWSSIWFNILENQNNNVEKVYCYTKEYKLNPRCLNQRNIKMINECDEAFVVWDGIETGGTWHFIQNYRKVNKPLKIFIYPEL